MSELERRLLEAPGDGERYVSEDEAREMVLNADGDSVASEDIIDEDTGEVYLQAGQSYNESPWSPDHRLDKRKAAKNEKYAERAGVWEEYWGRGSENDDDEEDDWFETERARKHSLEDAYRAAVTDFAGNWTGFKQENPDVDPEDAAPDAAESFFYEYPEWRDWTLAMGMKRSDMKSAVADYVYDAMTKGRVPSE